MADNKPYGDVRCADPKNGKYPIDTEAHAKAAWSYINMPKNAAMYPLNGVTLSEVKDRIKAACRKFGIQISDDSDSGRGVPVTFTRNVPLENISIRSDGDGRIVEAYAAVFGTPTKITDQDGQYEETLDPAVFNRAIANAAPQGPRKSWQVGVFYNHGRTISNTPSERYSMPCGKVLDMKADDRGLWTEIRYHKTEVGEEVLENIRNETPGGYSFSGQFLRSSPGVPRGGFRRDYRTGAWPSVRRTESTLRELGWTPFPAYPKAEVIGMRAQLLEALSDDPELAMRMLRMLDDGIPLDPPSSPGIPYLGPATGDPSAQSGHSGRSVKEEMLAARSAFLQRHRR